MQEIGNQKNKKWLKVAAGVFVLLLILFFVFGKKAEKSTNLGSAPEAANQVVADAKNSPPKTIEFLPSDIVTASKGDIARTLTVSGALRADKQAAVKAIVAGEVREVLVREGETVQQGQVLVRMDNGDFEARLNQAKGSLSAAQGQLDIAKQNRDSNQSLLDKNFISKNAYDNSVNQYAIALANVETAKGALDVAKNALNDTVIEAPISGIISNRMIQPGEKVSPDNRLLDVVDLRVLEMEAPVPAQNIASIKIAQRVQLSIEGVNEKLIGEVSRINPATTAGSRSIVSYIRVANTAGQLRAGMFGEAQLTIEKKSDVLMVPETAIQYDAEKPFVYVIESDLLTQKFLTLGLKGVNLSATEGTSGTTVVEVVSGLEAGAKFVKLNLGNLRSGSSVRFVTPTPTSTPNAKN
jgi:membrane fusion protein, multidrug efflux system